MDMRKFTVILVPDEDGYQAFVPHYPNVTSWGETPEAAFDSVRDALEAILEEEAASERGFVLPPVTPAPHVVVGEIEAAVPDAIIKATEDWLSGKPVEARSA